MEVDVRWIAKAVAAKEVATGGGGGEGGGDGW